MTIYPDLQYSKKKPTIILYPRENGTPTILDMITKTLILVSSKLNIQLFIKNYNIAKKTNSSITSKQERNSKNTKVIEIQVEIIL